MDGALQDEGIRGADLVFACIGPALEIFSRYSSVEAADGRRWAWPGYLEKVWEVVGRTALENVLGAAEAKARNGLAGALEEDARLTALFLWTLQATTSEEIGDTGRDEGAPGDDADADDEDGSGGKAKGFSPGLRRRAPLCPATGHRSPQVGEAHHRDAEGGSSLASGRRTGEAAFRRTTGRRPSRRGWSGTRPRARILSKACSFRTDRRGGHLPFGSGVRGTGMSTPHPMIVRRRLPARRLWTGFTQGC